jgi:hypothetical protein
VVARGSSDAGAQRRDQRVVRGRTDHHAAVDALPAHRALTGRSPSGHHHGSRPAITIGRAGDDVFPGDPVAVGELEGGLLGGQGSGAHDGDPVEVGDDDDDGGGGGADDVGALVVGALDVGADDFVCLVVGGGGGGVYVWPLSGGLPVTYAGGGNFSTGRPSRSVLITAAQVAVG